jgi:hypothetical protein
MSSTTTKVEIPAGLDPRVLERIAQEGHGPGAWHGADFKAALADVPDKDAFWRPAPGRHNIAEIALHHAYTVHSVCGKLDGGTPEPFALPGEDWFAADEKGPLGWSKIRKLVETEQARLQAALERKRKAAAKLAESARFELVLGITCHAVYHAGQVQLIKRLREK